MATEFPLVEIAAALRPLLGSPDGGTRIYRHSGAQEECAPWFELLTEVVGPTVSPGGVSMYCPVSRAAVHKRIKEGRLSIFLFHVTHRKTTLFGANRILREQPYGYVPVSECRAWREELEARAVREGRISIKELEGAKPDWEGRFLEWANKRERAGFAEFLKSNNLTLAQFLESLLRPATLNRTQRSNKQAIKKR